MIAAPRVPSKSRNRPGTVRSCDTGRDVGTIAAMPRSSSPPASTPRQVSIVALPECVASTLFGVHDVMNAIGLMDVTSDGAVVRPPFQVEIVGENAGPLQLASRVPINVGRPVDAIETSD